MGKGKVLSNLGSGQYSVEVLFNSDKRDQEVTNLNLQKSHLETVIASLPDGTQKNIAQLQLLAVNKRIEYLSSNFPENPTYTTYCADYTVNLSVDDSIGICEVPGELTETPVIHPGYSDEAVFNSERDGQSSPALNMGPASTYFNWALLPGWQKFYPTYRFGTITSIDYTLDTCNVSLQGAESSGSYEAQGLDVNQTSALSDVPIEYMNCNSTVFNVSDEVLVKFENQDWEQPKVIGFKAEPKPCAGPLLIEIWEGTYPAPGNPYAHYPMAIVFDIAAGALSENVVDDDGNLITTWPQYSYQLDDFKELMPEDKSATDLFAVTPATIPPESEMDYYVRRNTDKTGLIGSSLLTNVTTDTYPPESPDIQNYSDTWEYGFEQFDVLSGLVLEDSVDVTQTTISDRWISDWPADWQLTELGYDYADVDHIDYDEVKSETTLFRASLPVGNIITTPAPPWLQRWYSYRYVFTPSVGVKKYYYLEFDGQSTDYWRKWRISKDGPTAYWYETESNASHELQQIGPYGDIGEPIEFEQAATSNSGWWRAVEYGIISDYENQCVEMYGGNIWRKYNDKSAVVILLYYGQINDIETEELHQYSFGYRPWFGVPSRYIGTAGGLISWSENADGDMGDSGPGYYISRKSNTLNKHEIRCHAATGLQPDYDPATTSPWDMSRNSALETAVTNLVQRYLNNYPYITSDYEVLITHRKHPGTETEFLLESGERLTTESGENVLME